MEYDHRSPHLFVTHQLSYVPLLLQHQIEPFVGIDIVVLQVLTLQPRSIVRPLPVQPFGLGKRVQEPLFSNPIAHTAQFERIATKGINCSLPLPQDPIGLLIAPQCKSSCRIAIGPLYSRADTCRPSASSTGHWYVVSRDTLLRAATESANSNEGTRSASSRSSTSARDPTLSAVAHSDMLASPTIMCRRLQRTGSACGSSRLLTRGRRCIVSTLVMTSKKSDR